MLARLQRNRKRIATDRPTPFSQIPTPSQFLVVAVVALALGAPFVGGSSITGGSLAKFVLILTLGVVSSALSRGLEKIRRVLGDGLVPDLQGAWIVAAAVALPPLLIAAAAVAMFIAELPVRRAEHRHAAARRQPLYKIVYTVASVVLPAISAHHALSHVSGFAATVMVTTTIIVIGNNGLIVAAIASSGQNPKLALFTGSGLRQTIDVASTIAGAGIGAVLMASGAGFSRLDLLAGLGIPVLLAMQYVSVAVEAAQPAAQDPVTGMLPAARLRELAQLELESNPESAVILVQLLEETAGALSAAAGVLRCAVERAHGLPPALVGHSDVATFAVLLTGLQPEFAAWRRSEIHKGLDVVGLPHIVAMGYPETSAEGFHDVVMRVGEAMVYSVPDRLDLPAG